MFGLLDDDRFAGDSVLLRFDWRTSGTGTLSDFCGAGEDIGVRTTRFIASCILSFSSIALRVVDSFLLATLISCSPSSLATSLDTLLLLAILARKKSNTSFDVGVDGVAVGVGSLSHGGASFRADFDQSEGCKNCLSKFGQ